MSCFDYRENYINSYNVYQEKSDQVARSKGALDLYLPSALKKILNPSQDHRHFNILSVGSGDGEIDRHIIKIVQEYLSDHEKFRSTKIFNRALEPNPDFVSQYKEKLKRQASTTLDGDQTNFEVCQKTFQEYVQSKSEGFPEGYPTKFDIVHFVYSLFHVVGAADSDLEGVLVHCFEQQLKTNGQIVCITSEFIARNIVPKLWGGKPPGESLPEQIVKVADKRGWKVDHHKQEYSFDVTEVFDDKSMDGSLLLDFLTRVKNFRETATKDKVEESLQVIRDLCRVRDGKHLIEDEFGDILFISA